MEIIAKVGIYGDLHLNSKNYGAHRDYSKESLEYLHKITELVKENNITHLIGLGDFSFGRFHSLEYRDSVDKELTEQYRLTNGNHFELFGNHDVAGYGTVERDYYISRGLLRPSQNFSLGNVNFTMVDYGKTKTTQMNILDDDTHINVVLAHDFYKFSSVGLSNFGKAIELDHLENWFGTDLLICGHVHKIMDFDGYIAKGDTLVHKVQVKYPGCMMRPSYREGHEDTVGRIIEIVIYADGKIDVNDLDFPLWALEESFNLETKFKEKAKKEEKQSRVDISDVVKQLDMHDRNVGNPEDIISSMDGIDDKYKNKAIDLLKIAMG